MAPLELLLVVRKMWKWLIQQPAGFLVLSQDHKRRAAADVHPSPACSVLSAA